MTELFNHLEGETNFQEQRNGSMKRVAYHKHYLAQEAIRRIEAYQETKHYLHRNRMNWVVAAIASLMGEFNKQTGYAGKTDMNRDFCVHLREEMRRRVEKKSLDEGALYTLVEYINLPYRNKRKELQLLLSAAAQLGNLYLKETT